MLHRDVNGDKVVSNIGYFRGTHSVGGATMMSWREFLTYDKVKYNADGEPVFKEKKLKVILHPILKGGAGSGFEDHAGRPGEVGGSAPEGTGSAKPKDTANPKKATITADAIQAFENDKENYDSPTESASVVDANGNVVMHNKGTESTVSFSHEQISKMKDCVLTHNHPQDQSFSSADIDMAITADLKEVRATCHSGTFVMKRPSKGWKSADLSMMQNVMKAVTKAEMKYMRSQGMDTGPSSETIVNKTWEQWSEQMNVEYSYVPRRRSN
jgi:hypothetical protein